MILETYVLYLITVAVFFATPPGTSQILIISNALRFGVRRSLWTGAGDLSANALQMLAAGFGLAAIIGTSAGALTAIKWIGVAYLAIYGLRIFFAQPSDFSRRTTAAPSHRLFSQGFFTSLANPEAVFFFAALFPQFIDPAFAIWPQLLILGITYLVVDAIILLAFALTAERTLGHLRHKARALNRAAGAMMITAAALLGLKDVEAH